MYSAIDEILCILAAETVSCQCVRSDLTQADSPAASRRTQCKRIAVQIPKALDPPKLGSKTDANA